MTNLRLESVEGVVSGHNARNVSHSFDLVSVQGRQGQMARPRRLPAIYEFYQRFLRSRDSARFASDIFGTYTLPTLERLAADADAEIRRAAVLAVGHVGDFGYHEILGRALRDHDRGVRLIAEKYCRPIWASAGTVSHQQALRTAERLQTAGRFQEALRISREITAVNPQYAEAWRQAGLCFYGLDQNERAIQHLRRTLKLNPFQFEAAISLAQCYLNIEQPLVAYRWLRRAIRINPGLEQIRLEASRLLRTSRRQ